MERARRPDLAHRHGACGAEWTGLNTSHCGACHLTFSSTSTFDQHQRRGQCVEPATVGLFPVTKPWGTCWSTPPSEDRSWVDKIRAGTA